MTDLEWNALVALDKGSPLAAAALAGRAGVPGESLRAALHELQENHLAYEDPAGDWRISFAGMDYVDRHREERRKKA